MPQPDQIHEAHHGRQASSTLLVMCLVIISGGAMLPQRLAGMTNIMEYSFAETLYGVMTAGLLIFTCAFWILWSRSRPHPRPYRETGIGAGLVLLIVAGVIGFFLASDKRAAINHVVFIVAPIFMAILLVQLLTTPARVKILLYTLAALGVVNAYECADQFFSSNQVMVEEYAKDPSVMLEKVGIQPGTYEHMMFEHHLKSKDVRGFFSTSNSAGSFMLLALFSAIALILEGYWQIKARTITSGEMLGKIIVAVVIAGGLALTQSKGAIISAFAAAFMLAIYLCCRGFLTSHRKFVAICCIIFVVCVTVVVISYGNRHGTLPGGKSMLVRWQYWTASMRMYARHPLGVGGGNYAVWYPTYKFEAAPETVKDPHNFILSFLTQYGPLGLIGFLFAVIGAAWHTLFSSAGTGHNDPTDGFSRLVWRILPAIIIAMLLIRPAVLTYELGGSVAVALFIVVVLMILPLIFFAGTFFLLSIKDQTAPVACKTQAALFCGIAGVLLHNLIDFALFEPGVVTALWASIAAFVSLDYISGRRVPRLSSLPLSVTVPGWIAAIVCLILFITMVLVPVSASELFMQSAAAAMEKGDFTDAHIFFDKAARIDRFNADACYSDGRLYLYEFQMGYADPNRIAAAETAVQQAIARNPALYKYHARLAEICAAAAQIEQGDRRNQWLRKAYDSAVQAVEQYPGDAASYIIVGDIADDLGLRIEALEQYKKAVAIEDAYRKLFRKIYPQRELYSRLGENKYQYARSRIAELSRPLD